MYIGDSSACCRLVAWKKDIDSQVKQTCLHIREEILSEMLKVTVVNIESPETDFLRVHVQDFSQANTMGQTNPSIRQTNPRQPG